MRPLESKLAERRVKMDPSIRPRIAPDNTAYAAYFGGALGRSGFNGKLFGLGDSYCRLVVVRDDGSAALISSISRNSNVVTVNTSNRNPFSAGQLVTIVVFKTIAITRKSQSRASTAPRSLPTHKGGEFVVVRCTATGPRFSSFNSTADNLSGRIVVHGATIPWDNENSALGRTLWLNAFHRSRSEQQFDDLPRMGETASGTVSSFR